MSKIVEQCRWIDLREALSEFALAAHGVAGQGHIRPLHWYVACRLCLEGGFDPDEITPRPPFRIVKPSSRMGRHTIEHAPELGGSGEGIILGGLRTKQVDVVITKAGIGPVIAISLKGTLKAFRNLTNRLEEAGGDCTNLHITYPALVYAYWGAIRANRPGPVPPNAPHALQSKNGTMCRNDLAIREDGQVQPCVLRYHQALSGLGGRNGIRDDVSKYEAVTLTLVNVDDDNFGTVKGDYPAPGDPLCFEPFFRTIYTQYDLRFVYQAPELASRTYRTGWNESSPALQDWRIAEYQPRLCESDREIEEMSGDSCQ
jgi:hypothetical protein